MGLTKTLARFNGLVLGTIVGLAVFNGINIWITGSAAPPREMILATLEVGTFSASAAGAGIVLSWVRVFPLAPIYAGILSGCIGGILAFMLPLAMSISVTIPTQAIAGAIGSLVLAVLFRILPFV